MSRRHSSATDWQLEHPRLWVTARQTHGLRSLSDVRRDIRQGHSARLFNRLLAKTDDEITQPPWTPLTPLPGRDPNSVRR